MASSTVPALTANPPAVKVPTAPMPTFVVPEEEWVKVPETLTVPPLEDISQILLPETVIFPRTFKVPEVTHLNFPVFVACIERLPCNVTVFEVKKLIVAEAAGQL